MPLTTRRDFLRTGAALAAGVCLSPALAKDAEQDSSPQPWIRIADKWNITGDAEEMAATLKRYRAAGFDGLEGRAPGVDVEACQSAIESTGVPVHGVVCRGHWENRLSSPDPAVREAGRQGLEEAIRDCKRLGGTSVLLVPGRVTGPDETHDDVWKRSIAEIRKALPVAEEHEIHILIENVWNGFCETAESFRDYLDEIDSRWAGAYFDIGNVRKFGPPEDWIRILGPRIVKLDVKDWGVRNGFCRLGEGDVDWPAVRASLREIGYHGWATREGPDRSIEDTAVLMRELLDLPARPEK